VTVRIERELAPNESSLEEAGRRLTARYPNLEVIAGDFALCLARPAAQRG
jgi:hypothetical protein